MVYVRIMIMMNFVFPASYYYIQNRCKLCMCNCAYIIILLTFYDTALFVTCSDVVGSRDVDDDDAGSDVARRRDDVDGDRRVARHRHTDGGAASDAAADGADETRPTGLLQRHLVRTALQEGESAANPATSANSPC